MPTDLPAAPPYGTRTLAEVVPSLLAAVGGATADPLAVGPAVSATLLLVDGLGWELLHRYAGDAPFLASLATGEPLQVGFPATTATSLTSLGTGRPAGEHGIVGYTFEVPAVGPLNALTWRSRDRAAVDLRESLPPEAAQPYDTLFQRAGASGVAVTVSAPRYQDGSGLTRAAFRGAGFEVCWALGDLAAQVAGTPAGSLRYAYHGDLDGLGHQYGPGSLQWRRQLAQVDRLVESVASDLPAGALLAVTGDHGMVAVGETDRIDLDAEPELQRGVRLTAGEARVRHLYTEVGAAADVVAAWRELLADRAWVVPREEAVGAGWFGPTVTDAARARIGDVVAAMRGAGVVVRSIAEPLEAPLLGHHGSLTTAEQLVPLLLVRG